MRSTTTKVVVASTTNSHKFEINKKKYVSFEKGIIK